MDIAFVCSGILSQLSNLVEELSPEEYSRPAGVLDNHSVGQHIRHTLEFFICLEQGMANGCVNYDKRAHDKLIESDKFIALSTLARIRSFVQQQVVDKPITLEVAYGVQSEDFQRVPTNFLRELVYNIEHAVHHMALIKIGLREVAPHISLPADFGVASSTLRYLRQSTSIPAH
jgi:uncharacterized damage-inducible protein DinB